MIPSRIGRRKCILVRATCCWLITYRCRRCNPFIGGACSGWYAIGSIGRRVGNSIIREQGKPSAFANKDRIVFAIEAFYFRADIRKGAVNSNPHAGLVGTSERIYNMETIKSAIGKKADCNLYRIFTYIVRCCPVPG